MPCDVDVPRRSCPLGPQPACADLQNLPEGKPRQLPWVSPPSFHMLVSEHLSRLLLLVPTCAAEQLLPACRPQRFHLSGYQYRYQVTRGVLCMARCSGTAPTAVTSDATSAVPTLQRVSFCKLNADNAGFACNQMTLPNNKAHMSATRCTTIYNQSKHPQICMQPAG
jgi:hypothetical protein